MKFLAILMVGKHGIWLTAPPLSSDNKLWREADVRNPPAPAGFFTQEGLYGDGGQPRVVVTARH